MTTRFARVSRALPTKKLRNDRPEAIHVDEERVVSLNGWQARKRHIAAAGAQAFRQLLLLLDREQEICLDTDHQCTLNGEAPQRFGNRSTAVTGQTAQVHGARQL